VLIARSPVLLGRHPNDDTPAGIVIAIGAVTVVAAAGLAGRFPLSDSGLRLAVMAAALGIYAACCVDLIAVVAVIPLAWLVFDGFLLDRFGELVWRGWADVARIGVLVAVALVGFGVGAAGRRAREARRG
jgi:amino acid transporter